MIITIKRNPENLSFLRSGSLVSLLLEDGTETTALFKEIKQADACFVKLNYKEDEEFSIPIYLIKGYKEYVPR